MTIEVVLFPWDPAVSGQNSKRDYLSRIAAQRLLTAYGASLASILADEVRSIGTDPPVRSRCAR